MNTDFHRFIPRSPGSALQVGSGQNGAQDQASQEIHPRAGEYWAKSRIPLRHKNTRADFELHLPWAEAMRKIQKVFNATAGSIVVLLGGRGTGKTQAAVEMLRYSANKGCTCRYATAMDFFQEIKGTFSNDATDNESRVLRDFTTPDVLCLDELQVRTESGWENNLLTHMIDKRYQFQRSTILIANIVPEELKDRVGDSIYSRTMETGGVVLFIGPSFRSCDRDGR